MKKRSGRLKGHTETIKLSFKQENPQKFYV